MMSFRDLGDMRMDGNGFVFNSIVLREESGYTSLCLDLDVASQGETIAQAREALLEAVTLYLETALENNLPWLRPVPQAQDPRFVDPAQVVDEFPLNVSISIRAYA
jgi:predicted RNase H-like HicB family nuclease